MAKRKYVYRFEGNLNDPKSMGSLSRAWIEWMKVHNYSEATTKGNHLHMNRFIRWCAARNLYHPDKITKPIIERYQRHLYYCVNTRGKRLSFRSQHGHIVALRSWFRWLVRQNYLTSNPASEIMPPRIPKTLPARILSHEEVEDLLNAPDLKTMRGVRDRAIMEVFYGTGIRRMELAGLDIDSVQLKRRCVIVRRGKGQKDRMIPISKRAAAWLEKYLYSIRDELLVDTSEMALFLTFYGNRFTGDRLSELIRKYLQESGVSENGGPHMLRHAMATAMLENGADLRIIQAILGHACIDTTEIYTHTNIQQLKQIMDQTHPGKAEKQNRPPDDDQQLAKDNTSRPRL